MNIYVANINYKLNDEQLKAVFEEFGTVSSARIIKDKETGRSRGFGFVEMPDDAQGQTAIDRLNGADVEGKILSVSLARPREDRPQGGGFRKPYGDRN